ncbi:MAG: dynamin family protein [Pseudomonadota bacterium]
MSHNDLTGCAETVAGTREAAGRASFEGLAERIAQQRQTLQGLADIISDEAVAAALRALAERTARFAPRVSLVGQVKAGKTMLTNALAGAPGLLPVDVNPWTSAITSLHFNQSWRTPKALFRFFGDEDWQQLIDEGGRLGALARRADFAGEAETVKTQVEGLKQAAKDRLGDKFEALIGRSHGFDSASRALIQRYVCAGQSDGAQTPGVAGRYSEITKSADLVLEIPAYAVPLTICDTPGVNDTFLVREQLTLESLENTDICVIVLSAHQALSSADIGLLRLLIGLKAQQIVLFVNRIDELADPVHQTREIETRMRDTLRRYAVAEDAAIVFGSAACAVAALSADPEARAEQGFLRLGDWRVPNRATPALSPEDAWEAAGLPALLGAIAARIEGGPSVHPLDAAAAEGLDLARRYHLTAAQEVAVAIDAAALADRLDPIVATLQRTLQTTFNTAYRTLRVDLERRVSSFAAGECERLAEAMLAGQRQASWSVETDELRRLLADQYNEIYAEARRKVFELLDEAIEAIEECYCAAIGSAPVLRRPMLPDVPVPVSVSGSMAVDADMPWWRNWLGRRRAVEAQTEALRQMIVGEAVHMIGELTERQIATFTQQVATVCRDFLSGHTLTLLDLADTQDGARRMEMLARAGVSAEDVADLRLERAIEALELLVPAEGESRSAAA